MRNYYSTFTYYNSKYYESSVQCENIALIPRASIRAENQQQSATAFIVAFITMKTWTSAVVPAVPWIRKWIFAVKARKCETGLCTVKRARRVVHSAERNHVITNSGVEIRGRREWWWLKRWSTVRKRSDFSECKLLCSFLPSKREASRSFKVPSRLREQFPVNTLACF